jgi:alkaline phosphatase D
MSSLRAPHLGPIVGHTTGTTARLWIRAHDSEEQGSETAQNRRTLGVIAITETNGAEPANRQVHYFRLRREYDRTGTFTLGQDTGLEGVLSDPLAPGTKIRVRLGTLTVDDPYPQDDSIPSDALAQRLPDPTVWWNDLLNLDEDRSMATFTTFVAGVLPSMSFILGSCRYPGLLSKVKHSDAIFGPLLAEAEGSDGRDPAQFVLMAGDQIYADMLNRHIPAGLADTFAEFQERYHEAFGSRHMRRLLRSRPTYMILDDHEIEDNWTQDRIYETKSRRVFNLAINAYQSYQWIHGPTNYGKRLFYDFECGGFPFFVVDTRTQRFIDQVEQSLDDNHLLGTPGLPGEEPGQIDVLLDWLIEQQQTRGNTPKFVVTSSVFAPNPMSAREQRKGSQEQKVKWQEASDSWPAFPKTRKALLKTIIDNEIQNVVFLSGDIHCSNVAQLHFSGSERAQNLKAASITSSAFYWPFPFADGEPSNYVHDSKDAGQRDTFEIDGTHSMDYVAWNFTQEDNYCRVDVDQGKHQIVVRPYDSEGELITKSRWLILDGDPLVSELELEPW